MNQIQLLLVHVYIVWCLLWPTWLLNLYLVNGPISLSANKENYANEAMVGSLWSLIVGHVSNRACACYRLTHEVIKWTFLIGWVNGYRWSIQTYSINPKIHFSRIVILPKNRNTLKINGWSNMKTMNKTGLSLLFLCQLNSFLLCLF